MRVISYTDPALDLARMKLGDYIATRDESLVETLPGATPTWFTLGKIDPLTFISWVDDPEDLFAKYQRAFQLAVRSVDGSVEGRRLAFAQDEEETVNGRKVMRYSESNFREMLDSELVPPAVLYEVGEIAYLREFLGKARVRRYPSPPGSRRALAAMQKTSPPAAAPAAPKPSAAPSED